MDFIYIVVSKNTLCNSDLCCRQSSPIVIVPKTFHGTIGTMRFEVVFSTVIIIEFAYKNSLALFLFIGLAESR